MRTRCIILLFAVLIPLPLFAADPCELGYDYTGDRGPENWGRLRPEWRQCSEGTIQSPIRVGGPQDDLLPLNRVTYGAGPVTIRNTGHELKVFPNFQAMLVRGGARARLTELHFHVDAEHEIPNSPGAQGELHLLHELPDGKVVVLAVLINEGSPNPALAAILAGAPPHCQSKAAGPIDLMELLPIGLDHYFSYVGSLTTPDCKEGLLWVVLNNRIEASGPQLRALVELTQKNNRPRQQIRAHEVRWRQAPR